MNNEFLGERRKALEEAYFAKHNRALLERLRAGSNTAADSGGTRTSDDLDKGRLCAEGDTRGRITGVAAAGDRTECQDRHREREPGKREPSI
jgi:hypothetical protein